MVLVFAHPTRGGFDRGVGSFLHRDQVQHGMASMHRPWQFADPGRCVYGRRFRVAVHAEEVHRGFVEGSRVVPGLQLRQVPLGTLPVAHPGEEGYGEREQLRRVTMLRKRLFAGSQGALRVSAIFERADPGNPCRYGMRRAAEPANSSFEPSKPFLSAFFISESVGIRAGVVLITVC